MSCLQEAEKSLDDFISKYDSCATCEFWEQELFGGKCNGPELSCGYLSDNIYTCEQHEFRDINLQKQLEELQDKWYKAWYIAEGFLYFHPPEASNAGI